MIPMGITQHKKAIREHGERIQIQDYILHDYVYMKIKAKLN